jgi:PAS domain-containing protein
MENFDHTVAEQEARPSTRNAVLTINAQGRITACNTEAQELLGWSSGCPDGIAATSVMPELPFSPNTPGYNLAFAVFNAANGIWMRQVALLKDGQKVLVDVALSSVVVKFRRYITLSMRIPIPAL